MKIGILTYQRAENYGAMLQSYALKTYLMQLGHQVEMVDYWPEYHEEYFRIFSRKYIRTLSLKGKIAYLLYTFISLPWLIKRKKNFNRFIYRYLHLQKKVTYRSTDVCKNYDIVLYGSDQIWRKHNLPGCIGYDEWYFGSQNIIAEKKITYAASMGVLNITAEDRLFLSSMFDNFTATSVREKDLQYLLSSLDRKATLVLDPVFLLKQSDWEELIPKKQKFSDKKYILFYNLLLTKESVELAEKIANHYGYEIKEIYKRRDCEHNGKRYIKSAGVEEFLSLIYNAELVVSNSFHGVAFSIIFKKPFYAVGMGTRVERVLTLLTLLGIKERYIINIENIDYHLSIDYGKVNKLLDEQRNDSLTFLTDSLEMSIYENK
jgi:hypothetical protein